MSVSLLFVSYTLRNIPGKVLVKFNIRYVHKYTSVHMYNTPYVAHSTYGVTYTGLYVYLSSLYKLPYTTILSKIKTGENNYLNTHYNTVRNIFYYVT